MVATDQLLLVVSILEGRRFPRRAKFKLIIEAKFDGETLCTDPVDHIETPHFTTELAWELDKKTLHQHKLQRTPIKLQCFAVDSSISHKELVGYIILDLRSAQAKLKRPQWFPLLNSKYQRSKPEVQLRLGFEDDAQKTTVHSPPQHSTPSKPGDITPFQFVLNEAKGYYELGPNSAENEIFIISVTIRSASNLVQLIPSTFMVPEGQGFYFLYNLFGNNVASDVFYDLLQPSFAPERASIRVYTQEKILKIFLENFPGIKVILYCGGHPLGSSIIPLEALITDEKISKIESLFPLVSTDQKTINKHEIPAVNISVVLNHEDISVSEDQTDVAPVVNKVAKQVTENIHKKDLIDENINEEINVASSKAKQNEQSPKNKTSPVVKAVEQKDTSLHHFCYSIDLRSVHDLQVTSSVNCFLKYSYPFFGSSAPVLTSPPIEVRRHMEILLPKSFCAFDFATNPMVLRDTLSRVPLVVEVWHRDPVTKDVLLGVASLNLAHVFSAKKLVATRGKSGTSGQVLSERVHIIGDDRKPVGEINVVLGLEDLGVVNPELLGNHDQNNESSSTSVETPVKQKQPIKKENNDPRKMAEYQTALELEMWKQQQQDLFTTQLKNKEIEHMKTLAEEWKKRDKEREVLTKKKLEEYVQLEEKLKRSIIELERREKQLLTSETGLIRVKDEQKREHDRKMVELREASRRMKEDCEHLVELERGKVRNSEEEKQRVLQQLSEVQSRLQEKENEFLTYKEQQLTKPEMKLEAELSLLRVEKVELERKLEGANKSKIHYKQQWSKALKELGKVKQNEQNAAWARLKQQEKELEQLRLRFIAAEEKELANTEKEELQKIKNEINRLKEQELSKQKLTAADTQQVSVNVENERAAVFVAQEREQTQRQEEFDNRIAKLIEERDTLLQTGVYTTEDRIISELDRQIREAIANKG